jgi:enoyl-CoA hydratase
MEARALRGPGCGPTGPIARRPAERDPRPVPRPVPRPGKIGGEPQEEPMADTYQNILVETRDRVGLVTLNRPKQLNALNDALMDELGAALLAFDADDAIGAIVITGSEKAFAAGADIGAMANWSYMDVYRSDYIGRNWETIRKVRKPVIAAVAGFALGGGCELAMMCDFVIAAETARFGQPEIKLGVIPGAGGTQRLPRAVSKAKAMDLCLTARMMDAAEAERAGLVSRVVQADKLLEEALGAATTIAGFSLPSVMMIKESINRAYETPLAEGVLFERRLFHSLFATEDQKEGMAAFVEKRPPSFRHR